LIPPLIARWSGSLYLAPGDKVMQIENVDIKCGRDRCGLDSRSVTDGFFRTRHAGAMLCGDHHKVGKSEYPAKIIPMLTQHYAMLQRNLLYTDVTRRKRLVALVGQKKAIAIAVRTIAGRRRWSKLAEWLRREAPLARSNSSSG
jgi:exodeoxyribonuclease V alpha subunit